jgi:hypothetical protein
MVTCGISDSFESLSPTSGQITYVLLSRSPLAFPLAGIGSSDLHVLCTPPAFVLSQDQTLRQKIRPPLRAVHLSFEFDQKINEISLGVPVTLQLLKIVPRPPNGIRPTGVMRTFMIPTHARLRQSERPRTPPYSRILSPRRPRRRYGAARRPALPHRAAAGTGGWPFPPDSCHRGGSMSRSHRRPTTEPRSRTPGPARK